MVVSLKFHALKSNTVVEEPDIQFLLVNYLSIPLHIDNPQLSRIRHITFKNTRISEGKKYLFNLSKIVPFKENLHVIKAPLITSIII